jgi:DNA (cytosine-5)-methyltransferase 1
MRARLQDFPDEWAFVGGLGSVADQIGNAVAPAMGQAMGLALSSALKGWEFDWAAIFGVTENSRRKEIQPPSMTLDLDAPAELEVSCVA